MTDTVTDPALSLETPPQEEYTPQYSNPPQDQDLQKLWQEYLQKCCENGQLRHQLSQLENQLKQIEKKIEITERAVSKAALSHMQLQQQKLAQKHKEEQQKAVTQ